MPCRRLSSFAGVPASSSFRVVMICSSVKRLFRMGAPGVVLPRNRHSRWISLRGQAHVHVDLFDYSAVESRLTGYDACLFCLGVSSAGMNEAEYTRAIYELTMAAARTLARLNPAMTFCFISGAGTDGTEQGRSMWARGKGRSENALLEVPFKAAYMFPPAFILPLD